MISRRANMVYEDLCLKKAVVKLRLKNQLYPQTIINPYCSIVEDNADMRHYIRKTLSDHYKVIEAANGKERDNES